jgi:hypothetical protein
MRLGLGFFAHSFNFGGQNDHFGQFNIQYIHFGCTFIVSCIVRGNSHDTCWISTTGHQYKMLEWQK